MNSPSFSVIICAHNRQDQVANAFKSIVNQTYDKKNIEIILVNDGSEDLTGWAMDNFKQVFAKHNIKVIHHERRLERVASRNDGMKAATNEWICWLDSDDEYMTNYLSILADAINQYPEYRIFNFGSIIHHHRTPEEYFTKVGEVFKPEVVGKGHESFKSGKIGTGRFIFKRELLDEIPLPIPALRPYGDPGCFPELNRLPEYPMREDGQWIPFGNPWGEDYYWYYKLTRDNISKPLDLLLYIEHKRP